MNSLDDRVYPVITNTAGLQRLPGGIENVGFSVRPVANHPMAPADPSKTYPVKSTHVTWKVLDDESVLLNLDTGVYFTLNVTGTAVWERLDGATSLAEIGKALCEQFDISFEEAQSDLIELTHTLLDEGLVRVTDDPSTTPGTQRA